MDRILFVDDETKILQAYTRTLRKSFKVSTAEGAKQALAMIKEDGPFPVIVVDMQMPEVNGVQLLQHVKKKYPDTVRIMLTGNADQKTAVDAVNKGDVYRFLNKPCPPDEMTSALNDALTMYRDKKVEKDLLENTVKGSIALLIEVLAVAKPKVFGRAQRVHDYTRRCVKQLGYTHTWEIETVALLSQIGLITLSDSIIDKVLKGNPLSEDEQAIFDQHPAIAKKLVSNVPRLEKVGDIIGRSALMNLKNVSLDSEIPTALRIISPIMDLMAAQARGLSLPDAFQAIESSGKIYDHAVLSALQSAVQSHQEQKVVELNITQLEKGMILAKSIKTFSGALLLDAGQMVSDSLVARLLNFAKSNEIDEKVFVTINKP